MAEPGGKTGPTKPQLSLHVKLKDRSDLSGKDAVQGELFVLDGEEDFTKGYKGPAAAHVAGITYRQLDYWARKQIVVPSITQSHGSGSRRLYSFRDVIILAVSKRLLDAGVNLQNVNKAISFLMKHSSDQLERMTILCDGDQVLDCSDSTQIMDLMTKGQAVFGVSVTAIWHKVETDLQDQESVDLSHTKVKTGNGRVIDELAELRLRKKLDAQRAARQDVSRAQSL